MPEIGEKAPTFELPRDGGGTLTSADFAGKTLVLFFYPRDDTSGCTRESVGFSKALAAFKAAGAAVVGVSKDSVDSHEKFVARRELTLPLLSDENGNLCEGFGVWKEKSMYGKKFMGIERSTFVIDGDGFVRAVWRRVKVPGHVEAVLETVRNL
ncbi:MAG: peroxiredoxin [Rhodobacteraceae bacterium]|nr:peroxiredoxin [Paracoccaceae bacterium]